MTRFFRQVQEANTQHWDNYSHFPKNAKLSFFSYVIHDIWRHQVMLHVFL